MTLKIASKSRHTGLAMFNRYPISAITIPLLACTAFAQSKTEGLLLALATNTKQVAAYQWKQKTTVVRKGSASAVKIDEIRFDQNGQPIRLTLLQPDKKHMGPIRAHKAAEVRSTIEEVMQLVSSYIRPSQIKQTIQTGEIWERQGSIRVHAKAVILPFDDVNLTMTSSNSLPARLAVSTVHRGHPVTITAEYEQLANGPNVMTRMTVQVPEEDVVVQVESFNFVRLSGAAAL